MEFENSKYAAGDQPHDRRDGRPLGTTQDGFLAVPNHPQNFSYQNSTPLMKTYESVFRNGDNFSLNPRDSEYFTKELSATAKPKDDFKEAINSKVRELILREMERQNSAELKANQQSGRQKCYHSRPFTTIQSGRLDSRSNQPRHDVMIDPCCFDRHCSRRKSGTVYEAIIREQREATLTSARKRSESRPESKSSTPSRSRSKGNKGSQVHLNETAPTTRTIWVESNRDLEAWTPRVPGHQNSKRKPGEPSRPVLSPVNGNTSYKERQVLPQLSYYADHRDTRAVLDSPDQRLQTTAASGQDGKEHWNHRQTTGTHDKDRLWANKENRLVTSPLSPEKSSNLKAALALERGLGQYKPTDLRGRESAPVWRANRLSTESLIAAEQSEQSLLTNATLTQAEVDKLESRFSVVAQEVKKGLTFLVNTQITEHKGKEWEQSTDLIQQLESLKAYTKSLELQNREKDVEILNLCVTLQDLSKTTREVLRKVKVRK